MEPPIRDPTTSEVIEVKKVKDCSFQVEGLTMEQGTCTFYGACRYQGQDYMYQVNGLIL